MPLEASEPSAPTPEDASTRSWVAADAPSDAGLAGLRQHLDRLVSHLGLRSVTVVVDDPDLGRQAFRAGSGDVEAGTIGAGPGVLTDPAVAPGTLDAELLVALCAASLRVDVLRDAAGGTGELTLRRLPGVFAVELEDDGDLTICRVHVGDGAPADVGRVAARALPAPVGTRLVVEVVRTAPESAAPLTAAPVAAAPVGPPVEPAAAPESPAAPVGVPGGTIVLLAVRSVPEDGEIEVHLARGNARAVGRAPLSRGLAGAAEAVLAAAAQVAAHAHWRPSWVRTVETTADGHFVVAAALVDPAAHEHHHGIATGSSPIDAAARATVGALITISGGA
jgi:hypothetical protein